MKIKNSLALFNKIASDPYDYIKTLKEKTNKKIIGSTCTYTPEEIIIAAGAHPFRISGQSQNLSAADAHIQAYGCSMVRCMLEDGLSGDLNFLDGVVFPHSCDSIQRLSDIWRLNIPSLHFDILLPVKLDSQLSQNYFAKVIKRFKSDIEEALDTSISDKDISEAIHLMNQIRTALGQLYTLRAANPALIKGADMAAIVKASMVMDKEELLVELNTLISLLSKTEKKNDTRKRILISGSICSHPDIYQIIENKDAVVVWDDLCSGSRYFEGLISETENPYIAISERFTNRFVCPAKHISADFQLDNMKRLIADHRIEAVLFIFVKFCEPFSFDYPDIKNELEKMNMPYLMVEMDQHNRIDEQLRTRIDTLLEIMQF